MTDTAGHRTPNSGTARRRQESRGALVVAAASAVGGALAGAQPTGAAVSDVALSAAFAALVTLAASRAKRWALLPLVAAAVAGARGWVLIPAVAGAALAMVGARGRRRSRQWGALAGGLGVQALLRLPDLGFHGASALVTVVAVAPVLVTGYQACRRSERRTIRRVALATGAVVVVVTGVYGALLLISVGDLEDGGAQARAGLASVRSGDTEEAVSAFAAAEDDFGAADARLGAWWAAPARAVPVLGQHARAVASATEQGRALAEAAGTTVETADYDQLRSEGGRFDLERIAATEGPLTTTADAIATALSELRADRSPWLVAPLADELDDLDDELRRADDEASLAVEAIAVAPDLLGADGPRRYLVVFVTPAELRGSGGFIGSYAEVTAADGALALEATGSAADLPKPDDVQLDGLDEYEERYGRFRVGRDFRDLTFSPHFPYDAEAVSQVYPQVGGRPVDGVISIDPIALAGLLELTGPVEVAGFGRTLDADTAADFLLRDNYALFPDNVAQSAALTELVEVTFDELTSGDLPGPRRISSALAPATRQGRIRMWSPVQAEQELFARIGATGAFPAARPDHDFLAVSSQNSGNNKIDVYQSRDIAYRATVDDDGTLEATATVTVRNDAPIDGSVPEYVVGNADGDPLGTNRMLLSIHTPHLLTGATLDGEAAGVQSGAEAGFRVYTVEVVVPPGGTATLEVDLTGTVDVGSGAYVLDLAPQPTVTPDQLEVRVDRGGRRPDEVGPLAIDERDRISVSR